MKIDPRVLIRRLASQLGTLGEILENWEAYLLPDDAATDSDERYAHALRQYTNMGGLIYQAMEPAAGTLKGKRRHRVMMTLHLLDTRLEQIVDDIRENDDKAACVTLMLFTGKQARRLCGNRFALAEADLLALNGFIKKPGHTPPVLETVTFEELALVTRYSHQTIANLAKVTTILKDRGGVIVAGKFRYSIIRQVLIEQKAAFEGLLPDKYVDFLGQLQRLQVST